MCLFLLKNLIEHYRIFLSLILYLYFYTYSIRHKDHYTYTWLLSYINIYTSHSSLHPILFTRSSRPLSSQSPDPLLPDILIILAIANRQLRTGVYPYTRTLLHAAAGRELRVLLLSRRFSLLVWLHTVYIVNSMCLMYTRLAPLGSRPHFLFSSFASFFHPFAHRSRICIITHMRLWWLLQGGHWSTWERCRCSDRCSE